MRTRDLRFAARVAATLRGVLRPAGPSIGTVVRLGLGQFLNAPPPGTVWYRAWNSDAFELFSLLRHPVLEVGDVIGLGAGDPIPLPPSGTRLLSVHDPDVSLEDADRAAILFRVVDHPAARVALAVPEPAFRTGAVYSIDGARQHRAPKGQRWQVLGADGRNPRHLLAALVHDAGCSAAMVA